MNALFFNFIDFLRRSHVVKEFRNYVKKDQNLGLAEIEKRVNQKLSALLIYAKKNVPKYKILLNAHAENEIFVNPRSILEMLPDMSKQEILKDQSSFVSVEKIPFEINRTGGTTGVKFQHRIDKRSISKHIAFNYYLWHKFLDYELGDPILVFSSSSIKKSNSIAFKIYSKLQNKHFIELNSFDRNNAKYLRLIKRIKFIYGYPTLINAFIDRLQISSNQITFNSLKGVITTSEHLTAGVKNRIKDFFRVPVLDCYGARDGGVIAGKGDSCSGYHFNHEDCLINAKQLIGFEYSEMLLTDLNNYAMPLIKYSVGDLGEVRFMKCSCGSESLLIDNFLGRVRDVIYFPNGDIAHGAQLNSVFFKFPEIEKYRVHQHSDYSVKIFIRFYSLNSTDSILREVSELIRSLLPSLTVELIVKTEDWNLDLFSKEKLIISEIGIKGGA